MQEERLDRMQFWFWVLLACVFNVFLGASLNSLDLIIGSLILGVIALLCFVLSLPSRLLGAIIAIFLFGMFWPGNDDC